MNHVPADIREAVRETYHVAADALEQRGFYAGPQLFLITEAKALEVELRGIADAAWAQPGAGLAVLLRGQGAGE
jgi:hypothetical protein